MLRCHSKESANGLVALLWFIATLKAGKQPQTSHDQLLVHWEKQHGDPKHKAQRKQPLQAKRRGLHGPNDEYKQDKTSVAANSEETTISPSRKSLRVVNNCAMTHPMVRTMIIVLRMAVMLSDSASSIVIEISRAKHHSTRHLKINHISP